MFECPLPCPFCGGINIHVDEYDHDCGHKRWRVVCCDCMGQVDTGTWQSKLPAIKAWNTRFEDTCKMIVQPFATEPTWACSNCNGSVYKVDEYCPHCKAKVTE